MATIPLITVVDIVLVSTFLHLLFAFRDHLRRRGLPYPPGPKPWPIIGNLLNSPKGLQWTLYTEMSKKHGWETSFQGVYALLKLVYPGDILYLQVFGQGIVVLCSLSSIKDLLEKRGEIFSDRPTLPMHHLWAQSRLIATFGCPPP
jgi:hypothetical protein